MLGDREAALANDLTKLYEKVVRGRLSEIVQSVEGTKLKGEYIVVIAGIGRKDVADDDE